MAWFETVTFAPDLFLVLPLIIWRSIRLAPGKRLQDPWLSLAWSLYFALMALGATGNHTFSAHDWAARVGPIILGFNAGAFAGRVSLLWAQRKG